MKDDIQVTAIYSNEKSLTSLIQEWIDENRIYWINSKECNKLSCK